MIEKISLIQLSKAEHKYIENAANDFGPVFIHAHNLVFYSFSFVSHISPEAYAFSLFLSQVQKSLVLCLLSAIRNHDVQFHMMLRQALENAPLACYALYKPKTEEFFTQENNGILHPKKKANEKAYKWLNQNFSDHSAKIKNFKDIINESFAHANILPTPQNLTFEGQQAVSHFFDCPDKLMTKQRLWWIGNVSLGVLDLFQKVIEKFPLVTLAKDFGIQMSSYGKENSLILNELKSNPRFSRWINEQ